MHVWSSMRDAVSGGVMFVECFRLDNGTVLKQAGAGSARTVTKTRSGMHSGSCSQIEAAMRFSRAGGLVEDVRTLGARAGRGGLPACRSAPEAIGRPGFAMK